MNRLNASETFKAVLDSISQPRPATQPTIKSRELPPSECPFCKTILEACVTISRDQIGTIPYTGKLTVCVKCGTLLEFAEVGYAIASPERIAEFDERTIRMIENTIEKPLRTGGLVGQ